MNKQVKFVVIIAAIVVTLAWMGVSGVEQSATYYVTIEELFAMDDAAAKRIRVGGDVAVGSIVRSAGDVRFTITQQDETMPQPKALDVVYTGDDPSARHFPRPRAGSLRRAPAGRRQIRGEENPGQMRIEIRSAAGAGSRSRLRVGASNGFRLTACGANRRFRSAARQAARAALL